MGLEGAAEAGPFVLARNVVGDDDAFVLVGTCVVNLWDGTPPLAGCWTGTTEGMTLTVDLAGTTEGRALGRLETTSLGRVDRKSFEDSDGTREGTSVDRRSGIGVGAVEEEVIAVVETVWDRRRH
jgi:hypothetical protein